MARNCAGRAASRGRRKRQADSPIFQPPTALLARRAAARRRVSHVFRI